MNEKLAKFVTELLEKRGWSNRRLADEMDVAPTTVGDMKKGKTTPEKPILLKLAKAAQVPYYKVLMLVDRELADELEPLVNSIPDRYLNLPPEVLEFAVRFLALPDEKRNAILPSLNTKK